MEYKQKKGKTIVLLFLCGFIFICLFNEFIISKYKSKQIINNHNFTIGRLIAYAYPTSEMPRTITFEYCVDGIRHNETIHVNKRFDICKDFEKCKGKKYWVIYEKENPERCMIDLSNEIQDDSVFIPPIDLSNFKYSTITSFELSFKKKEKCISEINTN